MDNGTVCSLLPQVISLWAGVWAGRYNRKTLIMLSMDSLPDYIGAGSFLAGYQGWVLLVVSNPVCLRRDLTTVMAVFLKSYR